mmetsp:Transcript_146255/g.255417  ORF Transcript_146255/g.255417 Transcript_146255/m.255417 type:complete len:201 (+) Transcript_146255:5839-6441(+)
MTPPRPHSINTLLHSNRDDKVDIGIVVLVAACRDLNDLVGQSNEFCVGLQIFRSRHGDKLNCILIPKLQVSPLHRGMNELGGGHTIVSNQNLADGIVSATRLHVGSKLVHDCLFGSAFFAHGNGRHGNLVSLERRQWNSHRPIVGSSELVPGHRAVPNPHKSTRQEEHGGGKHGKWRLAETFDELITCRHGCHVVARPGS